MPKISENKMERSQAYEARAVVSHFGQMGYYEMGPLLRVPVYKFLTLFQGEGREAIPVEFVRPAPVVQDDDGDTILDLRQVSEGEFVVHPGLVYRKCLWFDNLMAAHMKSLQTFKSKCITVAEKADAPPILLPTIDTTEDQVTKQ